MSLGFSRDGFHWSRPDRRPFYGLSDRKEAWNYGNVQSAAGGCLVVGDELYFYCSGRNGTGNSTGLAVLRRDGFASMDAGETAGTLTTRPVTFRGTRLFVNAAVAGGELRAEFLDEAGTVEPFTVANCAPLGADGTRQEIHWKGASNLAAVAGKPVRLRFHLTNARSTLSGRATLAPAAGTSRPAGRVWRAPPTGRALGEQGKRRPTTGASDQQSTGSKCGGGDHYGLLRRHDPAPAARANVPVEIDHASGSF